MFSTAIYLKCVKMLHCVERDKKKRQNKDKSTETNRPDESPKYPHILCQVSQKKTNLSCFCQKSELNRKNIGVFWYLSGISVISQTGDQLIIDYLLHTSNIAFTMFPEKFQLRGFVTLTTEKWGLSGKKNRKKNKQTRITPENKELYLLN